PLQRQGPPPGRPEPRAPRGPHDPDGLGRALLRTRAVATTANGYQEHGEHLAGVTGDLRHGNLLERAQRDDRLPSISTYQAHSIPRERTAQLVVAVGDLQEHRGQHRRSEVPHLHLEPQLAGLVPDDDHPGRVPLHPGDEDPRIRGSGPLDPRARELDHRRPLRPVRGFDHNLVDARAARPVRVVAPRPGQPEGRGKQRTPQHSPYRRPTDHGHLPGRTTSGTRVRTIARSSAVIGRSGCARRYARRSPTSYVPFRFPCRSRYSRATASGPLAVPRSGASNTSSPSAGRSTSSGRSSVAVSPAASRTRSETGNVPVSSAAPTSLPSSRSWSPAGSAPETSVQASAGVPFTARNSITSESAARICAAPGDSAANV